MRRDRSRHRAAWLALALAACGGQAITNGEGGPPAKGAGQASVFGACTPTEEQDPSYPGAVAGEVSIGIDNPGCAAGEVCLVNHFEGRTGCPYGGPGGTCGAKVQVPVSPQCADRSAAQAVYCSCRCANAAGRTDDGASYCACPQSATCTQLVTPIGADSVSGAYCIKVGTAYDPLGSCEVHCDPAARPCP